MKANANTITTAATINAKLFRAIRVQDGTLNSVARRFVQSLFEIDASNPRTWFGADITADALKDMLKSEMFRAAATRKDSAALNKLGELCPCVWLTDEQAEEAAKAGTPFERLEGVYTTIKRRIDNGTLQTIKRPKLDANGKPKLNAKGNPIYEEARVHVPHIIEKEYLCAPYKKRKYSISEAEHAYNNLCAPACQRILEDELAVRRAAAIMSEGQPENVQKKGRGRGRGRGKKQSANDIK